MIQKVSILATTFGVCMAVEIAAGGAGQPVPQISPRPALFTEAQAASGEALYRQSPVHGPRSPAAPRRR
jgi:hypothetical protein